MSEQVIMEGEFPKLKPAPSFKRRFDGTPTSPISRVGSETELPRYTSLKDLSPKHADEPTANITIRNELVKHAASAYVLSATIISPVNRDQDWIPGIWERMKTRCAGFPSCWHINVGLPLQDLCLPVVRIFYEVVHRIRNGLRGRVEIMR